MTFVGMHAMDRKEGYVLRKLQRNLNSMRRGASVVALKVRNEDKTQAVYFSHCLRPPEVHLTLNGQNIPFVKHVKYLGVIFDKIKWRLDIEIIEAKEPRPSEHVLESIPYSRVSDCASIN
jgi:hypothetical protein